MIYYFQILIKKTLRRYINCMRTANLITAYIIRLVKNIGRNLTTRKSENWSCWLFYEWRDKNHANFFNSRKREIYIARGGFVYPDNIVRALSVVHGDWYRETFTGNFFFYNILNGLQNCCSRWGSRTITQLVFYSRNCGSLRKTMGWMKFETAFTIIVVMMIVLLHYRLFS